MKNLPLMYFEAKPPKLGKDSCQLACRQRREEMVSNILDFVENHAVRVVDSEEPDNGAQDGHAEHNLVVGDRKQEDIVVLDTLRGVVVIYLFPVSQQLGIDHHGLRGCVSWASSHAEGCLSIAYASQLGIRMRLSFRRQLSGSQTTSNSWSRRAGVEEEKKKKKWRRPMQVRRDSKADVWYHKRAVIPTSAT